jgi:hypothetical protein
MSNQMHYQYRMDKIMGFMYKHRTLRTLFDCQSHEWDQTDMNKKLMLVELLIDSGMTLKEWILAYKKFYETELDNKQHVPRTINDSLLVLYQNASQDLKFKIYNSIMPVQNNFQEPILSDLEVTIVIARRMYG